MLEMCEKCRKEVSGGITEGNVEGRPLIFCSTSCVWEWVLDQPLSGLGRCKTFEEYLTEPITVTR